LYFHINWLTIANSPINEELKMQYKRGNTTKSQI